jgi:hypothetical protein
MQQQTSQQSRFSAYSRIKMPPILSARITCTALIWAFHLNQQHSVLIGKKTSSTFETRNKKCERHNQNASTASHSNNDVYKAMM